MLSRPRRCSRSARASVRIARRLPPLKAFLDVRAFPGVVRGPVDFSHGRHLWISVDCRRRRAGVQPLAIFSLQ